MQHRSSIKTVVRGVALSLLFAASGAACGDSDSPKCGDGRVDDDEACDGAEHCTDACEAEIGYLCNVQDEACTPICGDGLAMPNECSLSGPSCAADCKICGDGKIDADDEDCDDGNRTRGDGCNDICREEAGYTCTGEPSECVASGLKSTKAFKDLTDDEIRTWCTWLLDLATSDEETVYCEPLATYSVETVDGCVEKYKVGIVPGSPWWCGHTSHDFGFDRCNDITGPDQARIPLLGCNVGEAEKFIFQKFRKDRARQTQPSSSYNYGQCGLFIAGGNPKCTL